MGNQIGFSLTKTPMQTAIEKATSEMLLSPDWETNLVICDAVNQKPSLAPAAVSHLCSRIRSNRSQAVLLALTLAETCVKNCGPPLHSAMATHDMMRALVNAATDGPSSQVKEQALGLIEAWGTAFDRPQAEPSVRLFVDTYRSLKQTTIEFPAQDVDAFAPVFTPEARESCPSLQEHEQPVIVQSAPRAPSRQIRRTSPSVVRQVIAESRIAQQVDCAVMVDIGLATDLAGLLASLLQQQEGVDAELVDDLRNQCVEWLGRLCEWLSHEQLEPDTNGALLAAIEQLNGALTAFQDHLNAKAASRDCMDSPEEAGPAEPTTTEEESSNEEEDLRRHMIMAAADDAYEYAERVVMPTGKSSKVGTE